MARLGRWFLGSLLVVTLLALPAGAAPTWLSSVDDALARAREAKKIVFLEIVSARNPECARRDADVYSAPGLQHSLEGFVTVRLDADRNTAAVEKWDPAGFPTLVVLQADGKEIARPLGSLDSTALATRLDEILADERSLVALRQKLAAEPEHVPSQLALARIYLRRGDAEDAQPLVEKLSKSTDTAVREALPSLFLNLGMALGKGGPSSKGREYFERVARDFPGTREAEQAHYLLGMIYFMQGDRQSAARSLEKVLEITQDRYLRERAERALRTVQPGK